MFILKKWPKSKPKLHKGGRKKKLKQELKIKKEKSILDWYYDSRILSDDQYQKAVWYRKMWSLYIKAIDAPQVKITKLETWRCGSEWSSEYIKYIEDRWNRVQDDLLKQGRYSRRYLDEVICLNQPSSNLKKFTELLDSLSCMI